MSWTNAARVVRRPGGPGRSRGKRDRPFPERGNGMRIDRQAGEVRRRQALVALDAVKLAQVKGGLKAERVQGTDPSLPGGDQP